jgi:hypothetical protein
MVDKEGTYDFSSIDPMIAAMKEQQIIPIWDLCHYGYPDDLDPLAGIAIGFTGSILLGRKSRFHWINSLLAIGVLIEIGFVLKELVGLPSTFIDAGCRYFA